MDSVSEFLEVYVVKKKEKERNIPNNTLQTFLRIFTCVCEQRFQAEFFETSFVRFTFIGVTRKSRRACDSGSGNRVIEDSMFSGSRGKKFEAGVIRGSWKLNRVRMFLY